MENKQVQDRNMGITEASELLGTPEATLYYWRHMGLGPRSFKIGRRVVYREAELRAWIAEQVAATSIGAVPEPAPEPAPCPTCGTGH